MQEFGYAVELQCRAEQTGERLALTYHLDDIFFLDEIGLGVFFQQDIITQGNVLVQLLAFDGEIHAVFAELRFELTEYERLVRAVHIHFVDEDKAGDMVLLQELPEGESVALHAVRTADDKYRVVEHLQGALGLGGEVHVPRGVEQGEFGVFESEHRLLGENGDPALALQAEVVEKGVFVVDSAEL